MDYSNTLAGGHIAIGSPYAGPDGSVFNSQSVAIENNSDLMLNYKTKLTNQLNFNLSTGGNIRYNRSQYIGQSGSKIKVPGFYAISNVASYNTSQGFNEKKVYSAYSLGQLSFSDYIYFDFTLRNDWSSTLPLKNNSYFYHSENLSFLFTKALGIKSPVLSPR